MQRRYDEDTLCRQRVELAGRRRLDFASVFHLPFRDHMHDLDAAQNDTRAAEVLEPEHRSDDAFDGPMVLLIPVVQILDVTNLDWCVAPGVHRVQRGQIGSAFASNTSER